VELDERGVARLPDRPPELLSSAAVVAGAAVILMVLVVYWSARGSYTPQRHAPIANDHRTLAEPMTGNRDLSARDR
jgi:hypothetical protein